MSLVRTIIMTVVAMSTLFVGVLETALADAIAPGVVRTQPRALDATGCVKSIAESDAEADDTQDDLPDHGLLVCVMTAADGVDAVARADLLVMPGLRAVPQHRATDLIRGPPSRG